MGKQKKGKKTMKKQLSTIMLSLIVSLSLSQKSNSATLTQLLSAYCVPKNASDCSGSGKATFTGSNSVNALATNYCKCSDVGMYYDKESRSCKSCANGTYTKDYTSTQCKKIPCPAGQIWELVESCPNGQIKTTDF